jgi:hypothetical protein
MLIPLHDGQQAIYDDLVQRNLIRCGRRFGKTTLLETGFGWKAICGRKVGWFVEEYKLMRPTFWRMRRQLRPVIQHASANTGIIELIGGGSIEFWTLDNPDAGRSRAYDDVVIDEASLKLKGLEEIVEQAIMPTLIDTNGTLTMAGTPKGIDPESYFYKAATNPKFRFRQFHAPTWLNPHLSPVSVANLQRDHPPLVYQQEFCAEFVDWSGAAFFSLDSLTVAGQPVDAPKHCDSVFAVIDTATKTGNERDGTAYLIIAYSRWAGPTGTTPEVRLLDYGITQIEGSMLEIWLPNIFVELEYWADRCGARAGSQGALIEDKNSGTILIQQALRRKLRVQPIDSKLTAMGKDERAIDVAGYVFRGWCKFCRECFDKVVNYKGDSANHLRRQVIGYRVNNKEQVEDDLTDCFTYAMMITCGNMQGF